MKKFIREYIEDFLLPIGRACLYVAILFAILYIILFIGCCIYDGLHHLFNKWW